MQLYPATDIKGGKCVRLTQGLFDQVKIYSDAPSDMAGLWVEKGTSFLHLVGLDDVLASSSVNEDVIRSIVQAVSVPVQIDNGIRNQETVQYMLNLGVACMTTGTKAVQNPKFVRELVMEFGSGHVVVGVDIKDGIVAIKRWEKMSNIPALDLCKQVKEYGAQHIICTDIARDGMLSGPNVMMIKKLTMRTNMDIIASGSVSSAEDLCQLYEKDIKRAIISKALYEKRIDLEEAVACFE